MTTVNYPSPVTVNGYSCKNCTDVDNAKRHIDPAHPKDGPYGVNAKDHPASTLDASKASNAPAVTFSGALAGVDASSASPTQPSPTQGLRLNLLA